MVLPIDVLAGHLAALLLAWACAWGTGLPLAWLLNVRIGFAGSPLLGVAYWTAALYCLPAVVGVLAVGLAIGQPGPAILMTGGAFGVGFGAFQRVSRVHVAPMLLAALAMAFSTAVGTVAAMSASPLASPCSGGRDIGQGITRIMTRTPTTTRRIRSTFSRTRRCTSSRTSRHTHRFQASNSRTIVPIRLAITPQSRIARRLGCE